MSNKSFNDFVGSISQETIMQIADDVSLKLQDVRKAMDENNPAFLGTQVSAAAYTISLEILGLYHKWREENHLD